MLNKQQVIEFLTKEYEKLEKPYTTLEKCFKHPDDFEHTFHKADWYLDTDGERDVDEPAFFRNITKIKIDDQEYLLMWEGNYDSWNGVNWFGSEFELVEKVKEMVEVTRYVTLE